MQKLNAINIQLQSSLENHREFKGVENFERYTKCVSESDESLDSLLTCNKLIL